MTSSFSLWVQAARSAVAGRIVVSIDTMLCILSDTQLFIKTINAVFKFRHNRACLVYECLRHGNSGEGEL